MGRGTESIAGDLTSGVFDADLLAELSSLSNGNDLDRLEHNLSRATAGLTRHGGESTISDIPGNDQLDSTPTQPPVDTSLVDP